MATFWEKAVQPSHCILYLYVSIILPVSTFKSVFLDLIDVSGTFNPSICIVRHLDYSIFLIDICICVWYSLVHVVRSGD